MWQDRSDATRDLGLAEGITLLYGSMICDEGAIAICKALKVNKTLTGSTSRICVTSGAAKGRMFWQWSLQMHL